jgi:hypothetical protein
MSGVKTVLIHQIKESMTNLFDSVEKYRPDYVFLLTSEYYAVEKPDFALLSIKDKDWRTIGDHVRNIEYFKLVKIKDAWHKTTMMEVYEELGKIKSKSQELAGKDKCIFYAGLADGEPLMTVGVAFAAVLHEMNTYYTRGRRTIYEREFVLDIDNLNKITATMSWLDSHYTKSKNLRYLREIIHLEETGDKEISSAKITEKLVPITKKAVDNALRTLEKKELINIQGKRNRTLNSTDLGKLIIRLKPPDLSADESGSDSLL